VRRSSNRIHGLLNGAIAFIVCRVQQYDAGDRVILIGQEEKYDCLDGDPLSSTPANTGPKLAIPKSPNSNSCWTYARR